MKSPILLSQYWKIGYFNRIPKLILHFLVTNNIFATVGFETLKEHCQLVLLSTKDEKIIIGAIVIVVALIFHFCLYN